MNFGNGVKGGFCLVLKTGLVYQANNAVCGEIFDLFPALFGVDGHGVNVEAGLVLNLLMRIALLRLDVDELSFTCSLKR